MLAKWRPVNEMVTATIDFAIATGMLEDRRKKREDIKNSDDSETEQQQLS